MLGIYLNVILSSLAVLALAVGISFYFTERDAGYIRGYTFLYGLAVFLTCGGYSVMGFMPNLKYAFIPRLFGLYGIDVFLLIELSFLTMELKRKQGLRAVIIGFFGLYILLDLLIFGKPDTLNYIRYDFHTSYENVGGGAFFFHYAYMMLICVVLLVHGIQWFKSKKVRRDKQFVLEIIVANFVLLLAAFPDMVRATFAVKYPTFPYCAAVSVVYFSYYFAVKQHILFMPTVKNVSREIFHSVDVPVIIFDMDGKVILYNSCAKTKLMIADVSRENSPLSLRSLFTLTDVETLRLLVKVRKGAGGQFETKIKTTGKECSLSIAVQFDKAFEPFCIIGTVLPVCREFPN